MRASWNIPTPCRPPARLSRRIGDPDDTLIYYVIGDNGASAEGTLNGTFNEMLNFNGLGALETPEYLMGSSTSSAARLIQPLCRRLGACDEYALSMDQAGRVPLWRDRNGTIVHWPNGIKAKGENRDQFHHVIDVAPTILEAAGLPQPASVDGVARHRSKASACSTRSTRAGRRPSRDPVLRDVRQPRHLP